MKITKLWLVKWVFDWLSKYKIFCLILIKNILSKWSITFTICCIERLYQVQYHGSPEVDTVNSQAHLISWVNDNLSTACRALQNSKKIREKSCFASIVSTGVLLYAGKHWMFQLKLCKWKKFQIIINEK